MIFICLETRWPLSFGSTNIFAEKKYEVHMLQPEGKPIDCDFRQFIVKFNRFIREIL